jgi:mono/diheme cytochrome c family protein
MKTIRILSLLIFIGLIITNNCAAGNEEITKGQEVYQRNCQKCHGVKAIGQDPENPNGDLNVAPALNGTAHAWHHPPVFLFQKIKNRIVNKSSPMPPFAGILSDDEINAVLAYIKSLWPEDIRKRYDEQYKE